ncbi:MAG TPA: uracil-DNA glycosylase [Sphingomicrobium sp.]|nr:uracil-DNA glycosylase [Sphingomicrobium sp.]
MGGEDQTIGIAEARSALAWWLEAGVDILVQEESRDWLKAPQPKPGRKSPEPSLPPPNISPPAHETLGELQQWLASSMQLPLATATAKRVMPQGTENPAVMLLSEAPTFEDLASGQPIGGDSWELTKRMLAAIHVPVEQAYSASLSCLHVPGQKMSPADRERCGEIARRHIQLAKPKRLLLLGDGPAQALLGKPLPLARGHVHKIEGVRTVATFHPRQLINQPSNKSLAWKDLLLLMEDES